VLAIGCGTSAFVAQSYAKLREAAGLGETDAAYASPAMDFRHGPVAVATSQSLVWAFGEVPEGITESAAGAGATVYHEPSRDPLAQLVLVHRLALGLAERRGLDPDHPRLLTRSVVLAPR
jgi:fructoselysine-6-P-deglycase FrlB-like protein